MMSAMYCTLQNLIDRYGAALLIQLTDRSAIGTGEIDSGLVDRAIAEAGEMIDGYLAPRYALPLAQVPGMICVLAQQLAIWSLHVATPEDKIGKDYDRALATLRDISRGVIGIPNAEGLAPAASETTGVWTTDRERPFTEETMRGFI